jgi:hypothetical protein
MNRSRFGVSASAALVAALVLAVGVAALARGKTRTWKPVNQALLKLNNHPVKTWDVLQADKNHDLILVQVLRDWYILDLKRKRAYKANRADFKASGDNLVGPEPDKQTPVVKTDGWDSHDIGPAQQITIRFAESGDSLAIELPHPLVVY